MALTSLQACMDSSDWLQGTLIQEEMGLMDSSSLSSPSSGGDILTCSRPLIERRLRPQHDQALKCPRCESTHTKFCYYNNYSLTQPRYFCKTCRRYWTKGGTLRNIPVGGGCRKNKKLSSKKSSSSNNIPGSSSATSPTHLQLSFPPDVVQFSHLLGSHATHGNNNFMDDTKYSNAFLDQNPRPIDFMEGQESRIIGHNRSTNINMSSDHLQLGMLSDHQHMEFTNFNGSSTSANNNAANFSTTPYGMAIDHGNIYNSGSSFMDNFQRLMVPNYDGVLVLNDEEQVIINGCTNDDHEVKPNTKLLALEWQPDDQVANDQIVGVAGKDHSSTFGYGNTTSTGLSSWTGTLINGYGSSSANQFV